MVHVLKKIPIRKAIREKGKSICIISAVFFTTILFVTVFSTLFFIVDAGEEILRATSPMLADEAFTVTEEEYERICENSLVSEADIGIRIGTAREPSGMGELLLFDFREKMAQWMRYYPTVGRMPEKGNEIVVSDQFLRDSGLTFTADEPIEIDLTYIVEHEEYKDTFTIVGMYEMAMQPLHVALTSDDFYQKVCRGLEQRGILPEDATYRMAGIMFASRGNVRRFASLLIEEEGLNLEEEQIYLSDVSLLDSIGPGVWAALFCLLCLVMAIGYLFISNIFRIAITGDARFYGKLSTNGVTKREIKKMIRRENNILFLISVIPALLVGYAFSAAILPGILNAYTTFQIKRSGNLMIFVFSLIFSYATVRISEGKSVRLAKNASPIEMKKYMGKFGRVKRADNGDCLKKFVVRHLKSDKKKVWKVCVSIGFGILLANTFYAVAAGFDEKEYVKENIDADYMIADNSIFTNPNINTVFYQRTRDEEISEFKNLPGIKEAGGGGISLVCLYPPKEIWDAFINIMGKIPI